MNANEPTRPAHPSVLASLRSLIPNRPLSYPETLTLAERQAHQLLRLRGVTTAPVPSEVVTNLPRVRVTHHPAPLAGISHWNGTKWIITLNERDPRARRRVTLFHEYAHIIWHGHEHRLFAADPYLAYLQAEQAAEYFAYSALMPTGLLTAAWSAGNKHIGDLAAMFEVRDYHVLAHLIQLRLWLPAHHRQQVFWSRLISATEPTMPVQLGTDAAEAVA